jgi:hypothetical protein
MLGAWSAGGDVVTVDKRMQVVLGLLPADAVFIVRRGYVAGAFDGPCPRCDVDEPDDMAPCLCDEWEDSGVHVDPLLWAPKSSGYVSEYNPWQAGIYTLPKADYKPRGEDPDAHSYTVLVSEWMGGKVIQDGTAVAVLVDEIVRLRAALEDAQAFIDGGRSSRL